MSLAAETCVWHAEWASGEHLLVGLIIARYADEPHSICRLRRQAIARIAQLSLERVDQIIDWCFSKHRLMAVSNGWQVTMEAYARPGIQPPAIDGDFR